MPNTRNSLFKALQDFIADENTPEADREIARTCGNSLAVGKGSDWGDNPPPEGSGGN
jgi:hypothetical protein